MDNENLNIEQLKAQYDSLKSRLNEQDIINDKLIRHSMKSRINGIKNIILIDIACSLLVIVASPFVFHQNPVINASWAFVAGTIVMMLFGLYKSWSYDKDLFLTDPASCDLITFKGKVSEIRTKHKNWTKIAVALIAVWFVWLCLEIILHSQDTKLALISVASVGIGLIVGGTIGFAMDKKIIKNCDDIIDQIEN